MSEIYGPHVCNYVREKNSRPWLVINKQGGIFSLGCDPDNGRFRRQNFKPHTKCPAVAPWPGIGCEPTTR